MKSTLRSSNLRADTAMQLVDFAVSRLTFSVSAAQQHLDVKYGRANKLVGQLVAVGVLAQTSTSSCDRRFGAPAVRRVLLREWNG